MIAARVTMHPGVTIRICKVRSHIRVAGNEAADRLASQAADLKEEEGGDADFWACEHTAGDPELEANWPWYIAAPPVEDDDDPLAG